MSRSTQKTFKIRFFVDFVDADPGGVVHFSNYFRFFERAEQEFYRSIGLGGFSWFIQNNYGLPRVKVSCTYKSPLRVDDEIEVELKIEKIGRTSIHYSFHYSFTIHNLTTQKICGTGEVTVVLVDLKKWQPLDIPDTIIKKIETWSKKV